MPMKKFTLILLLFVGFLVSQAQKNNTVFDKNSSESAYQQKESPSDAAPKFSVNGKALYIQNIENGTTIEIYSALGAKIQTINFTGNPVSLVNLNKGVYIVRAGKYTQKIML